jgi:hypothetical protein
MEEIDAFGLKRIEGEVPVSELLWQGEPIGLKVDGIWIEKQYRVEVGYLLFLTENSPYEEGLHIYLLNSERRLLDALELGGPYAPAILKEVKPERGTALTFSFFGDDKWRLEVRRIPQLGLNMTLFSPLKYKRRFLARHWLDLRRLS